MSPNPLFDLEASYSEKRDFLRIELQTRIRIQLPGQETAIFGLTKDLSANGICFEADFAPEVGCELKINIPSVDDKFPELSATVQVTRTTLSSKENTFEIAAKIIEMSS